jgi:biotin synthase-related radical SAM superfamily protein
VLRHSEVLTAQAPVPFRHPGSVVGVSAGTAAVLGLQRLRQTDAPTTAYLMVGERCALDCAFCTQARSSTSRAGFLSRVVWPSYPVERTVQAIARSFTEGEIKRCCLQVTVFPGYRARSLDLVDRIRSESSIPVCVSIVLSSLDEIVALLEAGAERVTLALDAACERVYSETKGGGWQARWNLLRAAAASFLGHVGTHLIAGLGETEQEMVVMLQEMVDCQITVGLFAFTPVAGTAWDRRHPPALSSYRRIQAAHYLLTGGACRTDDLCFSPTGQIRSYGLSEQRLQTLLADGRAFETAGCAACNRPYYNERPGRDLYNYPRSLGVEEVEAAMSLVMADLVFA